MSMLKRLNNVFTAGAVGGLLNGVVVWLFGAIGITALFGVAIAPKLTATMLYPRIVWGGLWGLLFLLPLLKGRRYLRGLIFSLGPTLVQLFIVFPVKANKGMMGLELGALTPLLVIFFNAVWGIAAAYWLSLSRSDD